MKIGYPCINRSIGCTANSTFRLANYSEENLIAKISANLACLSKILEYNVEHNLLFFRISSDLIPFASHPVCKFGWQDYFKNQFKIIGDYIKKNNIRISMHPDQFVLINSPKTEIVDKSIADLVWHCEVLDLMGLDDSAKVQIHVGGVYGDKDLAISRFIENYDKLSADIIRRLAIENDDRLFSLRDCLRIHKQTNIPVIFDSFHHICLNNGEEMRQALSLAQATWNAKDGLLMVDYSSQEPDNRKGKHAERIDLTDFAGFLNSAQGLDFDIMLEIKDKETSTLRAVSLISN